MCEAPPEQVGSVLLRRACAKATVRQAPDLAGKFRPTGTIDDAVVNPIIF
jgi:hypothetical protein